MLVAVCCEVAFVASIFLGLLQLLPNSNVVVTVVVVLVFVSVTRVVRCCSFLCIVECIVVNIARCCCFCDRCCKEYPSLQEFLLR